MLSKLHKLNALHSIRKELFIYNNSDVPHNHMKNLLKLYIDLLPEDIAIQTYLKILAKLQSETLKTNFDLEQWRKLSVNDANKQSTQDRTIKNENAKRRENNKKFQQENNIKQKILNELRYKGCDVDGKNLLSVQIEDSKNLHIIFSDGSSENIRIYKNNGKFMTPAYFKVKPDKIQLTQYLSCPQLQAIIDNNGMTFTVEKQEIISTKSTHKKLSLDKYKEMAGSAIHDKDIETEYKIYSQLSFIHQEQFLDEIKVRKKYFDNVLKVFEDLDQDINDLTKLKQIAIQEFILDKIDEARDISYKPIINPDALNVIPARDVLQQTIDETLSNIINNDVKGEMGSQHIWSAFDKTLNNPRYSPYEILLDNAVNLSQTIHSEIFHFDTKQQMRNNIAQAFSEIKSQRLILPNSLTAEIFCIGVFNAGMKQAQNNDDLVKMNEILNEFGINIRFEEREITKIPEQETSNAYLHAERIAFRDDGGHKALADTFDQSLQQKFGKIPHKKEVHHFIPLRYNGFIDEELNQSENYVAVACQHEYNLDLHGLGHTFDTPADTLIKDKDGKISSMTYSKMRANGLGKTLLIPILQVKTDKGYEDILSNQTHKCISTDKIPVCYTQIPEYIPELPSRIKDDSNEI